MPLHALAWGRALRSVGLRASRREIYLWEGEPGAMTARKLFKRAGRMPQRDQVAALLEEKERLFQQLGRHLSPDPVLAALVRRLHRRHVPLALVTGTSMREVLRVVPSALRASFDVLITGDRVRHGKPHPEPYQAACRQLGVDPAHALVVENAPFGIRSARAAGAGCVVALSSSLPRRYLAGAHVVTSSTTRLAHLVEQYCGIVRS